MVESPSRTLSANTLAHELNQNLADELSDYLTDLSISELYPVNGEYDLFLLSYTPEDQDRLRGRIGESFAFLCVTAQTHMECIVNSAAKLEEYDRFIFLKSNTFGLSEEILQEQFKRMDTHDMLFGPSSDSFYMFGFVKEATGSMGDLESLNRDQVDEYSVDFSLHSYFAPERPIAESSLGLSKLRESLAAESGLAAKIDEIILAFTTMNDPKLLT